MLVVDGFANDNVSETGLSDMYNFASPLILLFVLKVNSSQSFEDRSSYGHCLPISMHICAYLHGGKTFIGCCALHSVHCISSNVVPHTVMSLPCV